MGLLALAEARLKEKNLRPSNLKTKQVVSKTNPSLVSTSSKNTTVASKDVLKSKVTPPEKTLDKEDSSKKKSTKPALSLLTVRTPLDDLYDLANEGKISLKVCSHRLNTPIQKIEEWARLLEDHQLIKIRYPAFGGPTIEARK